MGPADDILRCLQDALVLGGIGITDEIFGITIARPGNTDEELVVLLSEEDLALLEENVAETLDGEAEEAPVEEAVPTIELDEEATIEDFIEK